MLFFLSLFSVTCIGGKAQPPRGPLVVSPKYLVTKK